MNVIIGLLINIWDLGIKKPVIALLLGKVPGIELCTFLTSNFDYQNFPNPTEWLFNTSNRSLLRAARSSGAEIYIESCLSTLKDLQHSYLFVLATVVNMKVVSLCTHSNHRNQLSSLCTGTILIIIVPFLPYPS